MSNDGQIEVDAGTGNIWVDTSIVTTGEGSSQNRQRVAIGDSVQGENFLGIGTDGAASVHLVAASVAVINFPATQVISGSVSVINEASGPASVSVLNFPTTQAVSGSVSVLNPVAAEIVSGSVSVQNFPNVQTVSGSVSVLDFPANQVVSGSVSVTGSVNVTDFPAVQAVSGSVTAIPYGNQTVSGSVAVLDFPAVQTVAGSVSVLDFPANQAVSGSVGVTNFPGSFLTTVSGSVSVLDFPAVQAVSGSVSVLNPFTVDVVSGSVSVNNYPSNQVVSGSVSVLDFPAVQAVSGSVSVLDFPSTQTVAGSVGVVNFPGSFLVTASGSVSVNNYPSNQVVSGSVSVLESGNWYALNEFTSASALPSAVSPPTTVVGMSDKFGRSIQIPQAPRDLIGQNSLAISSTNASVAVPGIANTFTDISSIVFANTSGTATSATLSDGTNTYYYYLPAGDTRGAAYQVPLPATSASVQWTVTTGASVQAVDVTVVYIKNK